MSRRIVRLVVTALVLALVAGGGAVAGASLAPRPTTVAPAAFPDVPPTAFYAAAVRWARDNGITTGVGSTGLYFPESNVTRGEMAVFLQRLNDLLASRTLARGPIVIDHSTADFVGANGGTALYDTYRVSFSGPSSLSGAMLPLSGPADVAGAGYRLESVTYCLMSSSSPIFASVQGSISPSINAPSQTTPVQTTPTAAGTCATLEPTATVVNPHLVLVVGSTGTGRVRSATSTWVPVG